MIHPSADEALATPCDVFVEDTKPDAAKRNIVAALLATRNVATRVGVHRGLDALHEL